MSISNTFQDQTSGGMLADSGIDVERVLANAQQLRWDIGQDYHEQLMETIYADAARIADRSVWVLIRDFEQESCFILLFWAMAIMAYKAVLAVRERALLQQDLLHITEGMSVLAEDTRELWRPLQALPDKDRESLLPRALLTALHRFRSTRNIQDTSDAVRSVCEGESERLDSELSMVRYIAWAIPSVGFIGTVRGIGEALGEAHKAVEGDIAGVTARARTTIRIQYFFMSSFPSRIESRPAKASLMTAAVPSRTPANVTRSEAHCEMAQPCS